MKEKWLFIQSGPCSPGYNMALDEALLSWHSQGLILPTLRFYAWSPATLSLGYFQRVEKEIDVEAVKHYGLGLVRRITGGRAVLHDQELTYSVVVSENHQKMPSSVTEAYRVLSEGLLLGFKNIGLSVEFSMPQTQLEKEALKNPTSAVCFDSPSWYELVVDGKKIVGSAQTRQKGVILQHGSILIDLDEQKLFNLFKFPNEQVKERMLRKFHDKAVAINDVNPRPVSFDQVVQAFREGFEDALDIELVPYQLTKEQEEEVNQLAASKYENDQWTYLK